MRIIEVSGLTAEKKVVGFYTFWPLAMATYEKMKNGDLLERNFTATDIARFDDRDAAVLYVPEIGVSKGSRFGRLLLKDALEYGCGLLSQNANFKLQAAWGYSTIGKSIASRLGMTKTPQSTENEILYELPADAARARCSQNQFEPTRQVTL